MKFTLQIEVEADKASKIDLQGIEKASNGTVISVVPQRPAAQSAQPIGRVVTNPFQQTQTGQTPALNG